MNNVEEFLLKEIIDLMKKGYEKYGTLSFDLIDSTANCLVLINLKHDKEFKELLGDGYYK